MTWLMLVSYFLGGAILANAILHCVNGMLGKPFQSLFAKPQGQGLSSSIVDVLWGFLNMAVGFAFIGRIVDFDLRDTGDAGVMLLGVFLTALLCARLFGRLHGGNNALASS